MTPEAQRIAIAEACGLIVKDVPIVPALIDVTRCCLTPRAFAEYRKAYPTGSIPRRLPDYLNDLNAMHEALQGLTTAQRNAFIDHLGFIYSDSWEFANATAPQRAEAFLRAIGKWAE